MMRNKLPLLSLLSLSFCLSLSSCTLNKFFVEIPPMPVQKGLALKGSSSLLLSSYFDDPNLEFTDDIEKIEEAFKNSSENDPYPIIFYDGVRGLDLCVEYGNYAHVATFALGNQQIIPLDKNFDPLRYEVSPEYSKKDIKMYANNQKGSLGVTLDSLISTVKDKYSIDINYVQQSDREVYDTILNMSDEDFISFKDSYDYIVLSEPYATRLLTLKESPIYDQEYANYTLNEDRELEKNPDYHYYYCLKQMYKNTMVNSNQLCIGVPQSSMFVNINYYNNNKETIKKILNLFNKSIFSNCIKYIKYVRLDFFNLSEDYNDPNEDPNSAQTLKAFEYQFNTVGISWNEVSRLQAWHPLYGESSNYNIYINRLCYVKDTEKYYQKEHIQAYYNSVNKIMPEDKYFIQIKL